MFHANGWTFVWIVTAVGAYAIATLDRQTEIGDDDVAAYQAEFLEQYGHQEPTDNAAAAGDYQDGRVAYDAGDFVSSANYARFGLETFPPSQLASFRKHFEALLEDARTEVWEASPEEFTAKYLEGVSLDPSHRVVHSLAFVSVPVHGHDGRVFQTSHQLGFDFKAADKVGIISITG